MEDNEAIQHLVGVLKKFKLGSQLKHFISYAVFPSFKGLLPGTRVDFSFPLVALVGANGIGKSSVLHALWGMPYGKSTSKFWFSTALDPILGTPRYFYGHWNESFGGVVESRKARVGKKRGLDYWEPARLSIPDGMQPLPEGDFEGKAQDRWNPVRREVVYINLKTSFGSFDRYFYFDEGMTGDDRREVMLREAKRLKTIVEKNKKSYMLGGRERLFANRELSQEEIDAVSRILGRPYESARYVQHSLYPGHRGVDLSVIFRRGTKYSEAFAGSGEVAAVSAVVQILGAPDHSLILLDEPETSLHPGAQRALLRFLLEQIKLRGHQVVISTHSLDFLEGLPHDAIKVFEDSGNGKSRVLPSSSPNAALVRLGRPPANRRRVLVEDPLAALLVERAMQGLDKGDAGAIEVKVAPGGAEAILKYLGPAAMVSGDDVYLYLDGDKRRVDELTKSEDVSPAKYPKLGEMLKKQIGCEPLFHVPGGSDTAGHALAKQQAQLGYFDWLRKRLAFLPHAVPEMTFLLALEPEGGHENKDASSAKKALRDVLAPNVDVSGSELTVLAKVAAANLPLNHADLEAIRAQLQVWLHGE